MLINSKLKLIYFVVPTEKTGDIINVLINYYKFTPFNFTEYVDGSGNTFNPETFSIKNFILNDNNFKTYNIFTFYDDIYSQFIWNLNSVKNMNAKIHTDASFNSLFSTSDKDIIEKFANDTIYDAINDITNKQIGRLGVMFNSVTSRLEISDDFKVRLYSIKSWIKDIPIIFKSYCDAISRDELDQSDIDLYNGQEIPQYHINMIEMFKNNLKDPLIVVKPFYEYYDQTVIDFVNQKYDEDFTTLNQSKILDINAFNAVYIPPNPPE
jgi:hypothetical protein